MEGVLIGTIRLNAQDWNGQGVETLCNSTARVWNLLPLTWHACIYSKRRWRRLHSPQVITQVINLLEEPIATLMLGTVSCMNFFGHSGHLDICNSHGGAWSKSLQNRNLLPQRASRSSFLFSLHKSTWLAILDAEGNPDRTVTNIDHLNK